MSNVELAKGLYESFAKGDIGAVLGAMDPKIEWREAEGNPYEPSGNAWIGPDAIMTNLFMRLGTDWESFNVHPQKFHDAGDTVVVEARYSGKHKETGKELDAQVCHVFGVRDGKFVRFQQFVDTAQLQDVVGARVSA